MTTSAMPPVTLDAVRENFVRAEASLVELTETLESLRNSSERFDDARGGLQDASRRVSGVADQLSEVTRAITGSVALLRNGIDVLEKSDPARVQSALDHLRSVVDGSFEGLLTKMTEAQAAQIAEAKRGIQALSREHGEYRTALGQTRDEVSAGRRWILLAIIATGAVIVSLQLLQLLK